MDKKQQIQDEKQSNKDLSSVKRHKNQPKRWKMTERHKRGPTTDNKRPKTGKN